MGNSNDKPNSGDQLDKLLASLTKSARRPFGLAGEPRHPEASDDVLLRVIEGTASTAERAQVAQASASMQALVADLTAGLADAGALPPVLTRAARYVFLKVNDALEVVRSAVTPLPMPAALAVRGQAAKAGQMLHEFEDTIAELPIRLRVERTGAAIDVQLRLPIGEAARVTLSQGGDVVDSLPVGKDGVATFRGLGDRRYAVEIRRGINGPQGAIELDIRAA